MTLFGNARCNAASLELAQLKRQMFQLDIPSFKLDIWIKPETSRIEEAPTNIEDDSRIRCRSAHADEVDNVETQICKLVEFVRGVHA